MTDKRQPHWAEVQPYIDTSDFVRFANETKGRPLFSRIYGMMLSVRKATGYAFDAGTSMFVLFPEYGSRVYKIGKEFGQVLKEVDCKVDAKYLPSAETFYCVEFPDDIRFDLKDGDWAHCAYVAVLDNTEQMPIMDERNLIVQGKHVTILTPIYRPDGSLDISRTDNINLGFGEDETVEQSIERCINNTIRPTGIGADLVEYVLKCILYINSGEPDLRDFKPEPRPHNQKRLKRWRRENLATIPLTLVGFDYKKPKTFNVDETVVSGHFRWQPCGPQRSMVKLIFIDEHVRKYSKELIDGLEGEL